MSLSAALRIFRFVYVAFIVFLSAKTFSAAAAVHTSHAAHEGIPHAPSAVFLLFLAGAEIAAALLFLWERTELIGGTALVAVYIVAMATDVSLGQIPLHLVFYAAVAIYIVYVNRRLKAFAAATTTPA